jgi:hypothetical protein
VPHRDGIDTGHRQGEPLRDNKHASYTTDRHRPCAGLGMAGGRTNLGFRGRGLTPFMSADGRS